MQEGDWSAKVACLALTVRNLRRELERAERDLTAMMDAEFGDESLDRERLEAAVSTGHPTEQEETAWRERNAKTDES